MYKAIYYEDKNGIRDVEDLIIRLRNKSITGNKNDRINFAKIISYIKKLEQYGTRIGFPVTRYLVDGLWELRPLRNRIIFAYYKDDKFILLTHFIKKSNKTPRNEIDKAIMRLIDYKERFGD